MSQTLQQFIIEDQNVTAVIDPAFEYRNRVDVLKNVLRYSSRKGFVMATGTTQTIALAGHIAQSAIRELRMETGDLRYLFLALDLPEGQPDPKDASESGTVIRNFIKADSVISADIQTNIKSMEQKFPEMKNDRGQMKTRVRTTVEHLYAKEREYLIVGTGNASENILGEATLRGDLTMSDILPLAGLTHEHVAQILQYLTAPHFLLNRTPTISAEGIKFTDVNNYLKGKEITAEVKQKIEQQFLNTERTRHQETPFITKFDHHKTINDSRMRTLLLS